MKEAGRNNDPQRAFTVREGMIHVSGQGRGYVATEKTYRDYHLIVEYKWGERVDGSGYVRNAGVLLHGTGPDGSNRSGTWMASLECQLAQGCEGDLIVIRGRDDVASPLGEWTRVECICIGDRVTVKINGVTVNEAIDVWPTSGKILLQNEGNEIFYRRFELHPLTK